MEKNLLMGIHDSCLEEFCQYFATDFSYKITSCKTQEEFFEAMENQRYSRLLFDANFTHPNSPDYSFTKQVMEKLKLTKSDLGYKILGISGNPELVESAQKENLPVIDKKYFSEKFQEFLV